MLVKKSCSKIVECHPSLVLNLVLMCLSSSFITVAVPSSSVAVVSVPSSWRAFQFSIECGEQFDESAPLFLAGSAWGWLLQNIS